jgi:hypothetical protein
MRNYSPLAGFVRASAPATTSRATTSAATSSKSRRKRSTKPRRRRAPATPSGRPGRERIRTDMTTSPVYQDVDGTQVEIGRRPKELGFKDNLKLVEEMAAHDFKYGKMPLMDYANAGDRVKQMKAEGMLDAHQAFVETGDIRKAAEKFNEVATRRSTWTRLKAKEIDGPFGKHVVYRANCRRQALRVRPGALGGARRRRQGLPRHAGEGRRAEAQGRANRGAGEAGRRCARRAPTRRIDAPPRTRIASPPRTPTGSAWTKFCAAQGRGLREVRLQAVRSGEARHRHRRAHAGHRQRERQEERPRGDFRRHRSRGAVVRGSNGQIGLDEAVGLVANPDIWLTKEEAQKQAQRDYSRGSNTFGGFEVKDDKGKVVKKLSKDEYVKQRAQRADRREPRRKCAIAWRNILAAAASRRPIAARGLPTGSPAAPAAAPKGGRSLSPKAQSVLNDALQ